MFDFLKGRKTLSLDDVAELLKTNPEYVAQFEKAYAANALDGAISDNLFEVNAKQAAAMHAGIEPRPEEVEAMISQIVDELVAKTKVWKYDGEVARQHEYPALPDGNHAITNKEISALPIDARPQLTADLMKIDVAEPSHLAILEMYKGYKTHRSPKIGNFVTTSLDRDWISWIWTRLPTRLLVQTLTVWVTGCRALLMLLKCRTFSRCPRQQSSKFQ